MHDDNYFLIIPASGKGSRMNTSLPKQYLELDISQFTSIENKELLLFLPIELNYEESLQSDLYPRAGLLQGSHSQRQRPVYARPHLALGACPPIPPFPGGTLESC